MTHQAQSSRHDLQIGDIVDVPGGMHGTVRFIGPVEGKQGIFAGVELAAEWAARGKNDGDVDGIPYFSTSIRGAGIFLPSSKAFPRPRSSPISPTQSMVTNGASQASQNAKPRPSLGSKFSQSVGTGRTASPVNRTKRPSLPRPESPLRRQQGAALSPHGRMSIGHVQPTSRQIASPVPGQLRSSLQASRAPTSELNSNRRANVTPRTLARQSNRFGASSRAGSRLANQSGPETSFDEETDVSIVSASLQQSPTLRKGVVNGQTNAGHNQNQGVEEANREILTLRRQLDERDRQLGRCAADLEEMQQSVGELQKKTTSPTHAASSSSKNGSYDEGDMASLRALIKEKNDKIASLTKDFDSHRADFRETIDILEKTSDETNRHYEERIATLEAELHLHANRDEDVESVAQQLQLLEKQVEDLEEGLEDSRRGESEARAEVEHLLGEVERSKAELAKYQEQQEQQSKEDATSTSRKSNSTTGPNHAVESALQHELANRDNEIKSLKAIVHSLSRGASSPVAKSPRPPHAPNQQSSVHKSTTQNGEVQSLINRNQELERIFDDQRRQAKTYEAEIDKLRGQIDHHSSARHAATPRPLDLGHSSRPSRPDSSSQSNEQSKHSSQQEQGRRNRQGEDYHLKSGARPQSASSMATDDSLLWCEMCDTAGHDILTCTNIGPDPTDDEAKAATQQRPPIPPRSQSRRSDGRSHRFGADNPSSPSGTEPTSRTPQASTAPTLSTLGTHHPQRQSSGDGPSTASNGVENAAKSSTPHIVQEDGMVAGKDSGKIDASKWCALCEKDGHDSVDCPFEDFE